MMGHKILAEVKYSTMSGIGKYKGLIEWTALWSWVIILPNEYDDYASQFDDKVYLPIHRIKSIEPMEES